METVISRWFAGCSEPPCAKLALSLGWIYCSNTTPTARGTELRALLRLRPAHGHPPGDRGLQNPAAGTDRGSQSALRVRGGRENCVELEADLLLAREPRGFQRLHQVSPHPNIFNNLGNLISPEQQHPAALSVLANGVFAGSANLHPSRIRSSTNRAHAQWILFTLASLTVQWLRTGHRHSLGARGVPPVVALP